MKYDFSRCNNLRWACGTEEDRHSGFCRVFKDSETGEEVIAFIETINKPYGLPREYNYAFMATKDVNEYVSFANFRINPRIPETYTDWQVGDVVEIDEFDEIGLQVVVAARINDIVICKYLNTPEVYGTFTCEELKSHGSLILTEYEKELAGESKCEFKDGDVVLVRDHDYDQWMAGIFSRITEDAVCKYGIFCNGYTRYKQCIPYNEKTWRLLGTTNEYKEE